MQAVCGSSVEVNSVHFAHRKQVALSTRTGARRSCIDNLDVFVNKQLHDQVPSDSGRDNLLAVQYASEPSTPVWYPLPSSQANLPVATYKKFTIYRFVSYWTHQCAISYLHKSRNRFCSQPGLLVRSLDSVDRRCIARPFSTWKA